MTSRLRSAIALTAALAVALLTSPAFAATKAPCKAAHCGDSTAPTVAISSPAPSATLTGTVVVSGSSNDNIAVASVALSLDGGPWQAVSGTGAWSWSWSTVALGNGSHTLTARALDTSGNAATATVLVNVANTSPDTMPPSVSITAPAGGSSVSGTVALFGSAADNVGLSAIAVAVDGGAWQPASGTSNWSWSWSTSALTNGSHTVSARATDTTGNTKVTSETVTVANPVPDTTAPVVSIAGPATAATVSGVVPVSGNSSDNVSVAAVAVAVDGGAWQQASGTTTWTYSWNTAGLVNGTHTAVARATDTSGNVATASESLTVSNSTVAPNTQGTWVSPEGVTINVNSAGNWTLSEIYSILTANALDLAKIGPDLTINVQDQATSQTQSSATYYLGRYSNYTATIWLQGVNSSFAARPDETLTHEYGHAWSMYWFYLGHQADWSSYLNARWTTSDGSLTLATDSRTNSAYSWQIQEIVADDYRLLFGSNLAISERPTHLNNQIPDPRNVTGLRDFMYNVWRTP